MYKRITFSIETSQSQFLYNEYVVGIKGTMRTQNGTVIVHVHMIFFVCISNKLFPLVLAFYLLTPTTTEAFTKMY